MGGHALAAHSPLKIMDISPSATFYPYVFSAVGISEVGSGISFDVNEAKNSAIGEFTERSHFYNDVSSGQQGCIQDYNDLETSKRILKAMTQLSDISYNDIASRTFSLVEVSTIQNGSAYLPLELISMEPFLPNRDVVPLIDSCGQSSHIAPIPAFESAVCEFIERQVLIASWLTGAYDSEIPFNAIYDDPLFADYALCLDFLKNSGEFYVLNLSQEFSAYVILIVYFSDDVHADVRYSVGLAAHTDIRIAIKKALNEFLMDFLYFDTFAYQKGQSHMKEKYWVNHENDNSYEVKKTFLFEFQQLKQAGKQLCEYPINSVEACLLALKKISPHIFIYSFNNESENLFFNKILSPDFFLHMATDTPLNYDNAFISTFHQPQINAKKRIPFP